MTACDAAREAFVDPATRFFIHSTLIIGRHRGPDGRVWAYPDARSGPYATAGHVRAVFASAPHGEAAHLHVWARDRETGEPTLDSRRSDELASLWPRT